MENAFLGDERRKSKRVRVSLSVIYRVNEPLTVRLLTANKEIKASILNLSDGGIAILTDYDVPVGTVLIMRFTLFKIDNEDVSFYGPVEITGEVRYNTKEEGQCRIGVQFTKIDEDDKKEIVNFSTMAIHLLNKDKK